MRLFFDDARRRSALPAWSLGCLVLFTATSAGSEARADPGSGKAVPLSNEARADRLFRSGESKFDGGDYDGACEDFSESLKLGPKLGTLLNLALCHETVGKLVTAWHEFAHAAAWAAQNNQRDRHEFATQHVRALEPRLPRIVLQLPADSKVTAIDLDGEPVPEHRWYLPLYVDPGEHQLALMAPGKQRTTIAFRVTSSPTDQVVYIPRLQDEVRPPPPAEEAPRPVDPTQYLLGLAGLGIGFAGVATGTTFGILAMTGEGSNVKAHTTVATVSFVAGAAFAATGGFLLWTSSKKEAKASVSPRHDGAALSVTATF